MGRYSSVQAYADNNANMRSIPYEQASGAPADAAKAPGAGTFHSSSRLLLVFSLIVPYLTPIFLFYVLS